MSANDKYPEESDRRRFVKGVVGGAALAGIGSAGAVMVNTATDQPGGGGGITEFVGIELVSGPAPNGMPMIPVRVDDEGYLMGHWPETEEIEEAGETITVAREDMGPYTYSSEWFQYCGLQGVPGIRPDEDQDNYFRSVTAPGYEWQQEDAEPGEPLHIDQFDDYESWGNHIGDAGIGKPADATWRSEDVSPADQLQVTVIRSQLIEERAEQGDNIAAWLQESTVDGVMAYLNVCTHFCCIPGYKDLEESIRFDAENRSYCQCHQSVYDPFTPVSDTFVALPRPEDD